MATYTDGIGFNKGTACLPESALHKVGVISVALDFVAIAAARLAAGATALTSTDVVQALPIPAKTLVLRVGLDVTTAEGATLTIDVGDGADTDGWLDGVDANTAASYCSALTLGEATPNTITGFSGGKYYSAADTIDVLINNSGIDTAVMRLWALVVDCA